MGSPIVVVDQNAGFDAVSDTHDGIHPNQAGEEKIAQKWFDAISQSMAPASCLSAEGDAFTPVPESILVAADDDEDDDENSNEDDGDDEDADSDDEDNEDDEDADSDDEDDEDDEDEEENVQPIYILPLGDSITQANDDHRSYRYFLWVSLLDEGINVDFVGSQDSNHNGNPKWPKHDGQSFDQDHEGHWGWRADELLANLPDWLQEYTPDVVLLHAGTNDARDDDSTDSTASELKQIIDVLREANPNVVILLAKLIPAEDSDINENIERLNAEIDSIAGEKNTVHSPVIVVDQNDGFSVEDDSYDGTHPSKSGERKMAEKWFEAVTQAVEAHPCLSGDASVDTEQASPLTDAVPADDVLVF